MTVEQASAGSNEKHMISKMKSTKVEVQERNNCESEPQVGEIITYNFTVHEEGNSHQPQNNTLINELHDVPEKDEVDSYGRISNKTSEQTISVSNENQFIQKILGSQYSLVLNSEIQENKLIAPNSEVLSSINSNKELKIGFKDEENEDITRLFECIERHCSVSDEIVDKKKDQDDSRNKGKLKVKENSDHTGSVL